MGGAGRRWRIGGAGEWQALENGRRWRLGGAGDWKALENGRRWRLEGAGEWKLLEKERERLTILAPVQIWNNLLGGDKCWEVLARIRRILGGYGG
jgi:hypothetical protein